MNKSCDTCLHSYWKQINQRKALQLCKNPRRAALAHIYETLAQALSENCCELWEPKIKEDKNHEGDIDNY